jgi:hypothetical protein
MKQGTCNWKHEGDNKVDFDNEGRDFIVGCSTNFRLQRKCYTAHGISALRSLMMSNLW